MVIVLVLLAAAANSTASLCERAAARRTDQNVSGLPFVRRVLAQPMYLAGVGAMTAGFLLQASALRDGAVSTVQTILTVELPLTVVLAAAVFHVSLSPPKSGAIAGMTVGLAALLLSADPTPGSEDPTAADWLLTLPVTAGALTMVVILGSRSRDRRRAALLGVASGGCFGLTAVLIKAAEIRLTEGWVVLLTSWPAYLLVATGATSVYLFGRAVQAGQLATAQPGVTIADPLTATVLGVVLFGDRIRAGWFLVPEVVAVAVIVVSTVVLSQSAGHAEQADPGYPDDRDDNDRARDGRGRRRSGNHGLVRVGDASLSSEPGSSQGVGSGGDLRRATTGGWPAADAPRQAPDGAAPGPAAPGRARGDPGGLRPDSRRAGLPGRAYRRGAGIDGRR